MELLIPVAALAGLYTMSKTTRGYEGYEDRQYKQPTTEHLSGMDSNIPSAGVGDFNMKYEGSGGDYKSLAQAATSTNDVSQQPSKPVIASVKPSGAAPFNNGGMTAYTTKYFTNPQTQKNNQQINPEQIPTYRTLTGESKPASEFTHDNMKPFFSGRGRVGGTTEYTSDPIFDNYTGAGSTHLVKSSQAPMFSPSDDMAYSYGAPNQSEFYQSRAKSVLSGRMDGVKLMQPITEGRGLGGNKNAEYTSALDSRSTYMPKTVDELRIAGKPKSSEHRLLGYEGAAHGATSQRPDIAPVHKNRPETFMEMGPERYFTTVGVETAPTSRPVQIERLTNRQNTLSEYTGAAGSVAPNQGAYSSEMEYEPSTRLDLGELPVGIASAAGRSGGGDIEYGRHDMPVYTNSRSQGPQETYFGSGFVEAIGAVVAPLLEAMRPTRKQLFVGNGRAYEGAKAQVTRSDFRTPGMYLEPTIRDSTHVENYIPGKNANMQSDGYRTAEIQVKPNERDTTEFEYVGAAASAHHMPRQREDNTYLPDTNKVQTMQGRMVPGAAGRFDGNYGTVTNRNTGHGNNERIASRSSMVTAGPSFTPGAAQLGEYNSRYVPQAIDSGTSRIDDSLMSAFKNNPYTHKLPGAK